MKGNSSYWPYAIAAFLAVVVTVNICFVSLALKSDDGLVDPEYYKKGVLYSSRLEKERALGWDIRLSFVDLSKKTGLVRVELLQKGGGRLSGATVAVTAKRPATDRFDKRFELKYGDGAYSGEVRVPLAGLWDFEVSATKDGFGMEKTFRVAI